MTSSNMTITRKVPLANNPNAANSPYRGPTASKRARANTNDLENDGSPPKKKQVLDPAFNVTRVPATRGHADEGDTLRHNPAPLRRPLPERDSKIAAVQNVKRTDKPAATTEKEALQNWKRHYRRTFPSFLFYFESLPSDVALRLGRQAVALGAKVERFFSKEVTHVITTRPIPAAADAARKLRVDTIDPSVLHAADASTRSKVNADAGRRAHATGQDGRGSVANDVLSKAREMGIKIWNLEKFERMIHTLVSPDGSDDEHELQSRRPGPTSLVPSKREAETDLSQLLRNERKNAPVDRKPWQDIIPFRGVYVYIHDMDERTKPIMVREYPRPAHKEDGKWPMLRSVSNGRCPFVEEPRTSGRDDADSKKDRAPAQSRVAPSAKASVQEKKTPFETIAEAPRTRSTTQSPQKQKAALQETKNAGNQMPKPQAPASLSKASEAPKLQRNTSGSTVDMPAMLGSTHANYRGLPRRPGGEPFASGMQANVTSAIRSQMYSSTAPSAPGQRVGMSKQQHQMSRRILEKQNGLSNSSALPSSVNVTDLRAAINKDASHGARRTTRARGDTGRLTKIHEDETVSEEEEGAESQQAVGVKRRAPVKRDPKPGYCENCRDKYDDFSEHIVSKTHRKFALANENFADLDKLLKVLIRR